MLRDIIESLIGIDQATCAVTVWRYGSELVYQSDAVLTFHEALQIGVDARYSEPGIVYYINCIVGVLV